MSTYREKAISAGTRELAEALVRRVGLDEGHARLTIDAAGGRVRSLRLEATVPATRLERFDAEAEPV